MTALIIMVALMVVATPMMIATDKTLIFEEDDQKNRA